MKMRLAVFFLFITSLTSIAIAAEEKKEVFVYEDHGRRDPFLKLVNANGLSMNYDSDMLISDVVLEGIVGGGQGNFLAIINSSIVKPGDTIGPFIVQKIEMDQVTLTKGQETSILRLKKEE